VTLRRLSVLVLGVVSFMAGTAAAQETPRAKRLATLKANLASVRTFDEGLSESDRRIFSSGAQNLFTLARRVVDLEGRFGEEGPKESALRAVQPEEVFGLGASGTQVSNPATDFVLSQTAGFTQSETSTAWCGNIVVVGYNDSGSLFETLVFGVGGLSFNGVARSIDRGRTFTDLLFLDPGPPTNFLGGDPVVACTSPTTFYYSSLLSQPAASGISVSKSSNGGLTYGAPVAAALKAAPAHFLDKSWMAVDPTNANRLFVTYTDFDNSGTSAGCPGVGRVAIEIVRSVDGGATWGAPQVIDEVCRSAALSFPFVQGSQVAVGPDGEVYVVWERYDDFNPATFNDPLDRELRSTKSSDHGATFAAFTKVADVFPSGDSFALRGGFRAFLDNQGLAIDRSRTASRGDVYVAFHDGGAVTTPDVGSDTGVYGFADAMVSRSHDGGATWDPPVRVNDNVEAGLGTDQYQPGVAVDVGGRVASCFYDRRRDPANFTIDRFCAVSKDGGQTWSPNMRQTARSFAPIHATDTLINPVYMGDYDTIASEFTLTLEGFVGAYSVIGPIANPDVKVSRLRP
jgi:BNR/Asp-box repeat